MDTTALLIALGAVLYPGVGGAAAALVGQIGKKLEPEQRNTIKGFGVLTRTQMASIVLGWPLIVAAASGGALIGLVLGLGLLIAFILGVVLFWLMVLLYALAMTILLSSFSVFPTVGNFAWSFIRRERQEKDQE